ncbi:MAG: hypothetical protein RMI79_00020 [Nitrososphaerota archaeon]|nr:hypothetical protein [Nitrososphaerota archaeon]
MISKTLKITILTSFLLISILIICTSLMSVVAQKDEFPRDFKYWRLDRNLPGFFKRGWAWNLNKSTPIGPYCNGFKRQLIEVSEELKENVINIAKSDQDVQKLLSEGYNITRIRPIISTNIGKDGSITIKAKRAIIVLCKGNSSIAFVWVDVENSKVTRIEILTRIVIEKP